jgi:glucosamine--fructose-6-phosphate aminotransferase (isomerizing)
MLQRATETIADQVTKAQKSGALTGPAQIFLGMGASLAAAAAPVWTMRLRGLNAVRLNAGDYPLPLPDSESLVIGVSQSGRSAETLAAMRTIDKRRLLAVVNVVPSPVAELAATAIGLGNLKDSYASTIGYTATIVALGMIADAWNGGIVGPAWRSLDAAVRHVEKLLDGSAARIAAPLAEAASVDFTAAAPSVGSAEAGALLLREVARVPATGTSTRQYLHGAMESASSKTAHVLIGEDREVGAARTLARAGCPTILLTPTAAAAESNLAVVTLPALPPAQRAILEALVVQSLAAETAKARGINADEFVFHHDDTKVT